MTLEKQLHDEKRARVDLERRLQAMMPPKSISVEEENE